MYADESGLARLCGFLDLCQFVEKYFFDKLNRSEISSLLSYEKD